MSVESDITQLQADVLALQGTLESIRQSLQDQIDLNETSAADADTTADSAVADTIVNAQDISALDVTLRLYIDSKFAQLRNDINSDFSTTLSGVTPQIESDVDASFTSQITSINATIAAQTSAAASSAYDANQSYLNASNVFSSLVQTDIPAIQARLTSTEGTIQSHTNDWTSLLSQYGYTSLQQGFDAQVIATNLAISTSAQTLKAEIEDPNGTSLGGTLHNNYYTEANTDQAIATAVTNVQSAIEDPNGSSLGATVDTQATAITDLENNASAGFLIKAQVDTNNNPTAVSLLELIAADDPTSGPVSIAKLQADDILLDGTVSAQKLQITDFTDYAQIHKFENDDWDDHWTLNQNYGSISLSTGTGFFSNNALVFNASNTSTAHVRAQIVVDVEPGSQYQIEIWARRSSNYAPRSGGTWGDSFLRAYKGTTNTQLQFTTVSAGVVSTGNKLPIDPQLSNATDFYKITGMISVPDDATSVTLKFYPRHSAGTLSLSSPKVIRKLGGELIVDGSITANLIQAGSITSAKLSSAQISTLGLTIGTLSSSPSGERLVLKDDSIVVYDANNVVRVKIGDLS